MRTKSVTSSEVHSTPVPGRQRGIAILAITLIILLVATIGTLTIGKVGLTEQQVVGSDVRNKEIYSAAIGGLEYGVNWLLETGNYGSLTWSDADNDDKPEIGDTADPLGADAPAVAFSLANADLQTGLYGHTVTYELLTDMEPVQYGDTDGDGVADEIVNLKPVVLRVHSVTSPVSGDTHLSKTVSVDVMVGGERVLGGISNATTGEFHGPPIVIEGCITGSLTGNPSLSFDIDLSNPDIIDVAIASTSMYADNDNDGNPDHDVDSCMPRENMEGHLTFCDVDTHPDSCPNNADMDSGDALDDPNVPEFRMGLDDPTSLWNTVFGAGTTKEDLLALETLTPLTVIIVDSATLHHSIQRSTYSWNGNQWHQDLGSADNPVILFFDETIDCPSINGSTTIYGIVYYEKEVCSNDGWGGGKVYGTLAKSGDLTGLNANAEIIATGLDFGNSGAYGDSTRDNYSGGIIPKFSVLPGTWRDSPN